MSDANIKTLLPYNPWISVKLFRYTVAIGLQNLKTPCGYECKIFSTSGPLPLEIVDLEMNGAVTVILNKQSCIPGNIWLRTRQRFRLARFVEDKYQAFFCSRVKPCLNSSRLFFGRIAM